MKLEEEILKLKGALKSLKEDHGSIFNDQLCSPYSLEENLELVKCDIYPSSKIEIINLKGQITQTSKTPTIVSISLSDERKILRKTYKKNAYVIRKSRKQYFS